MTCVIFKSIDDCDVYFGLGVFSDLVDPLKGDVGMSGEEEADDEVVVGVELPEFPIANWNIDFKWLPL